ncbi:MAG: alanyl-tRNA editing protein AlaXM [Candidatus Korarchaeum sp.]|nr:alanyl-tRNA editing protein AlaXM [Candidatus Korarchaeum sp.]MDW8035672.1 alanyl-tRNA editing protein AlaXM [Candidatus Korarchaeum sp.]
MTELVYQTDSYLTEFESEVVKVRGNRVYLERTAFHPLSGGVADDRGYLEFKGRMYEVVSVEEDPDVAHVLSSEPEFREGDLVKGLIDWERRYKLMRLHTADHMLAAVLYRSRGALVTGGHIEPEYAKSDFSLERGERSVFEEAIEEVNQIASKGLEVKIYFLPREEALKIPGVIKLADRMPPNVRVLRIVEIPGVDVQADGGPHVRNTREIGKVKLLRVENKGKGKKRVYFTLEE